MVAWGEHGNPVPPTPPCPVHLFHLSVPELYPLERTGKPPMYSTFQRFVSSAGKLSNLRRESWDPPLNYRWLIRSARGLRLVTGV